MIESIREAVKKDQIEWSEHAQIRLLERDIPRKIIEEYPNDQPYPSCLIYNNDKSSPLHVVVGLNKEELVCYIITEYLPLEKEFGPNFDRRVSK